MTKPGPRLKKLTLSLGLSALSLHGAAYALDTDGDGIADPDDPHPGYGDRCAPAIRSATLGYFNQATLFECNAFDNIDTVGTVKLLPGAIMRLNAEKVVLRPGFHAQANSYLKIGPFNRTIDTDKDGLTDYYEFLYGLDPLTKNDLTGDIDRDGLNQAQEAAAGTSPTNHDTDGDSFNDGDELAAGSNPLARNSTPLMPYTYAKGGDFSLLNTGSFPGGTQYTAGWLTALEFSVLNTGAFPAGTTGSAGWAMAQEFSLLNTGAFPGGSAATDGRIFAPEFSLLNVALGVDMGYGYAAAIPFSIENLAILGARRSPDELSRLDLADIDGDRVLDGFEVYHGLDPLNPADAERDDDADGLTNLEESLIGADPVVADTDKDGRLDGDEIHADGTDPLDSGDVRAIVTLGLAGDSTRDARMASDPDGNLHVIYIAAEAGKGGDLYYARFDSRGTAIGEPQRLTRDQEIIAAPAIAYDEATGQPVIGWIAAAEAGATLTVARLSDATAEERAPDLVQVATGDPAGLAGVALALDAEGRAHLAWERSDGTLHLAAVSFEGTPAAATTRQVYSDPSAGSPLSPSMAIDAGGGLHLAWSGAAESGLRGIYYAAFDSVALDTEIAPSLIVPPETADAVQPSLAVGAGGLLDIAYEQAGEIRRVRLDTAQADQAAETDRTPSVVGTDSPSAAEFRAVGTPALTLDPDRAPRLFYLRESETAPAWELATQSLSDSGGRWRPGYIVASDLQPESASIHVSRRGPTQYLSWSEKSAAGSAARFVVLHPDWDGDGISNGKERQNGSDKRIPDADGTAETNQTQPTE